MPSGAVFTSSLTNFFVLSEKNSKITLCKSFNFLKKKASFYTYVQKKPKTRGTAKNCVDHPNGGKGRNGIRLKKSP